MVGMKDKAVLVEVWKWGGMVPLCFEDSLYPVCFNRILSSIYGIRCNNGARDVQLQQKLTIFVNNGFVWVNIPVEGDLAGKKLVVLRDSGLEVVNGKKK